MNTTTGKNQALPLLRELTRIADAPFGDHDVYGFTKAERAAAVKAGRLVVEDGRVYRPEQPA